MMRSETFHVGWGLPHHSQQERWGKLHLRRYRLGLTFTEILFAIMLLGIGFIMVAAIFPVAIQQSQANLQDTVGVSVAQSGARLCQAMGFAAEELVEKHQNDPSTLGPARRANGMIWPFDDSNVGTKPQRFQRIKDSLIVQSDPRFAFIPVGYKMPPGVGSPPPPPDYAEVFVVAVQSRIRSVYDQNDADGSTFYPKTVYFFLTEGGEDTPDRITFTNGASSLTPLDFTAKEEQNPVAEGTFVFVADDQITGPLNGSANGRFYRVGPRVEGEINTWELLPGKDMAMQYGNDNIPGNVDYETENIPPRALGAAPSGNPAIGMIVGRGYVDPTDPTLWYDGPAQDLYATTVTVFFQQ